MHRMHSISHMLQHGLHSARCYTHSVTKRDHKLAKSCIDIPMIWRGVAGMVPLTQKPPVAYGRQGGGLGAQCGLEG